MGPNHKRSFLKLSPMHLTLRNIIKMDSIRRVEANKSNQLQSQSRIIGEMEEKFKCLIEN